MHKKIGWAKTVLAAFMAIASMVFFVFSTFFGSLILNPDNIKTPGLYAALCAVGMGVTGFTAVLLESNRPKQ